tara:strand:+ start:28 stop:495 length:468 start_codon:yes stop_codon:yes gene_type:complete
MDDDLFVTGPIIDWDDTPWDALIRKSWEGEIDNDFLMAIWDTSESILGGLEVQVVIDAKNDIYISKGTPSFVDFQTEPVGMRLPIECWIHTHPFGAAYFSGTDWRTINTWKPNMKTAIVLGKPYCRMWERGYQTEVESGWAYHPLHPFLEESVEE